MSVFAGNTAFFLEIPCFANRIGQFVSLKKASPPVSFFIGTKQHSPVGGGADPAGGAPFRREKCVPYKVCQNNQKTPPSRWKAEPVFVCRNNQKTPPSQ
jgi:hypothetical protein